MPKYYDYGRLLRRKVVPFQEKMNVLRIARTRMDDSQQFMQQRLAEILKNEERYVLKKRLSLAGEGRFDIPLPVLRGYVTELLAEQKDKLRHTWAPEDEKDLIPARKMTSFGQKWAAPARGNWRHKDLIGKRYAALSGFAVYKKYCYGKPKFTSVLENTDHYDLIIEPHGGPDPDTHIIFGQKNIFRDEEDVRWRVNASIYDKVAAQMLVNEATETAIKKAQDDQQLAAQRAQMLLQDIQSHGFVGHKLFNFTELKLNVGGKWYYIVFDTLGTLHIPLRCDYLENVFEIAQDYEGAGPWTAWHTEIGAPYFMNLAPADEMTPIDEAATVLFSAAIDNVNRRNFDMRAYDSEIFPDPSKLKFSPDRVIRAKVPPGKSLRDGIYEISTPETAPVVVNLLTFLDRYVGPKTSGGNTPGMSGQASEDRATIYYGNMQQAKAKIGLLNTQYVECWNRICRRFEYGVWEHLSGEEAVKIMGISGYGWDKIKREDAKPDFTITTDSETAEDEANLVKAKKRDAFFARNAANPLVNPFWRLENEMRTAEFSEDEIRVGMDTRNYGTMEVLSIAAKAIYDIVGGKEPLKEVKLFMGANAAFQEKILAFAYNNVPIEDGETFRRLVEYSRAHEQIVIRNTMRQAGSMAMMGAFTGGGAGREMMAGSPVGEMGRMGATASAEMPRMNA